MAILQENLLGALEAGGTKMVCAVGNEQGVILEQIVIPTEAPSVTMPQITAFFQKYEIKALGIACFGPLDLTRDSSTYGYITTTPKLAWRNYNIVGEMQKTLSVPIGFDTDVNGSALGEAAWGALRGLSHGMYITIGTGIGAGIIANNQLLHGMLHPEAGHILMRQHPDDRFEGLCPYHRHCFEGLASGPAIEKRWGKSAQLLADREDVWRLEAYYIAQAIVNYIMVLSPQRIVLGGGVMHQTQLMPFIREGVLRQMNGYVQTREMEHLEDYIVLPQLGDRQGILGALELGRLELEHLEFG